MSETRNDATTALHAALETAVSAVRSIDFATVDPTHAPTVIEMIETLQVALDAARLATVSRLDRGHLASIGWASPEDFLTHTTGGRPGAGRQLTRLVSRLADLPATQAAHHTGTISTTVATTIAEQVAKLPRVPHLRHAVEAELVNRAINNHTTPHDLANQLWDVVHRIDPEATEVRAEQQRRREERNAHASRYLSFSKDRWGGIRIRGYATPEDVETIKATLIPLAAPQPSRPCSCHTNPRATMVDPTTCDRPRCTRDGRDIRDHSTRLWDALVETCLRAQTAHLVPTTHRAQPRLTIHLNHTDLVNGLGGHLPDGTTISGQSLRRLACDASVIPVVMGSASEILDVGREQRLVTPGLWNALVARDHHCAFPGCTRPPATCHAHHIHHWADGGVTSLDNMALLCGTHHRITHDTTWTIQIDPHTGRPIWQPPPPLTREQLAQRVSWHIAAIPQQTRRPRLFHNSA